MESIKVKSIKVPFTIYADMDSLLEKIDTCHNDPEKSSTTKINKYTGSRYSFDDTEKKHGYCRGKDCIKMVFSKDLREHATKIISYEKKEMIPLTLEENKLYCKQKVCYISKNEFITDHKRCRKVRDHCHYIAKYRRTGQYICTLRYKTPKEIPVIFRNGSKYDHHFIIKELAEEFEGQFACLGENTEKYLTFSVPINKELESNKTITYEIKSIDSFRFMSSSLSSLVDNLFEGLLNCKCTDCKSYLEYISIEDELLMFNCIAKAIKNISLNI